MLAVSRGEEIMRILEAQGSIVVSDLSRQMNVTEETIRRDLAGLEKQNRLKRVHGGAYIPKEFEKELPFQLRRQLCANEKAAIAVQCLEYIEDGESILLDRSSTAGQIARLLCEKSKKVTVLTNSFNVIQQCIACESIHLIDLGGIYRRSTDSFSGRATIESLSRLFVDRAFVSCSGMNERFGLMDNIESEAEIRALMLKNSAKRYLIVDHNKFDKPSSHLIADFSPIDTVVTDWQPNPSWCQIFENNNIEMLVTYDKKEEETDI